MELTEGAKKALRDLEQHQRFWFILAKMEVTKSENSYTKELKK